jgi:hypothetical protein
MKHQKIISVILIILTVGSILAPTTAQARNPFKQFFRSIRRGVNFVVNLPNKATRWMGPVLGPIAADILTQNMVRNPNFGRIFSHARRLDNVANNVEEQKKILGQIQNSFREQANNLRTQAGEIRNLKPDLESNLLNGRMTLSEYQEKVVAIKNLAEAYEAAANKFNQSADRIKPENVVKMVARNVFRQTLNQIKTGVQFEVKNALSRYVNPEVISTLIAAGDNDADSLLDAILAGDISEYMSGQGDKNIDLNELKMRVRDRVKEILATNKDDLRKNWKREVNKVIAEVKAELEKVKKDLPQVKEIVSPTEVPAAAAPIPTGEGGCKQGYKLCPQCGISCIQANCDQVEAGHLSYEGYCICGSSGSIAENPKDPNKECYRKPDYAACPGCLYACVHFDEDCPLEGIGQ